MFCPSCRSEYRPGFTHCNDCDVDLVSELPRDQHPLDLVRIFETGNPALVPVVRSLLEEAHIECEVRNPREFDMFGTNQMLGSMQFWVRTDDADAARELLDDLVRYDDAPGHE